jgi:protein-tyrosine phosphatase
MNVLFICSKNKWRSRTAETIFRDSPIHNVKSAGTDEGARVKLTEKHLIWADIIFVMENKHRQIIKQKFQMDLDGDKIIVLDIPDEHQYMDEELIQMLKRAVSSYLDNVGIL